MTDAGPDVPLACVPDAIPAAARPDHFSRIHRLFRSRALERIDVPHGYTWRFTPDALDEIAAFVDMERRCCPFLRFRIDVRTADGPVWLTIDGPAGTQAFLHAEFRLGAEAPSSGSGPR